MSAILEKNPTEAEWLRIVAEKVQMLRFGVVQIIVHEGKVTQIESTEKTRLAPDGPSWRERS
ncbi:MAG: YezD family protein [Opitutales bacterium]|nr:YezD family protein [Opitutales bacterium]